jgi:gliding motility-associated-like protein
LVVRAKGATDCVTSDFSNAVTGKTKNPLGDEIFVPNAFSPNGDGNNDVLFVYGNTIQTMKLVIYNQYGQKVFESRDQHTGWDGTMNGRMQPVGVYVYYLEATLQDGKKVNKKGSITLIR